MIQKFLTGILLVSTVSSGFSAGLETSMLANCLGKSSDPSIHSEYCVSSEEQKRDKAKSLQSIVCKNTGAGVTTNAIIHTGNYKTVGETMHLLDKVMAKFAAGVPDGTVLGKMGDLKKGGEVDFGAVTSEKLGFDFKNASGSMGTVEFTRGDAMNFATLLAN